MQPDEVGPGGGKGTELEKAGTRLYGRAQPKLRRQRQARARLREVCRTCKGGKGCCRQWGPTEGFSARRVAGAAICLGWSLRGQCGQWIEETLSQVQLSPCACSWILCKDPVRPLVDVSSSPEGDPDVLWPGGSRILEPSSPRLKT